MGPYSFSIILANRALLCIKTLEERELYQDLTHKSEAAYLNQSRRTGKSNKFEKLAYTLIIFFVFAHTAFSLQKSSAACGRAENPPAPG